MATGCNNTSNNNTNGTNSTSSSSSCSGANNNSNSSSSTSSTSSTSSNSSSSTTYKLIKQNTSNNSSKIISSLLTNTINNNNNNDDTISLPQQPLLPSPSPPPVLPTSSTLSNSSTNTNINNKMHSSQAKNNNTSLPTTGTGTGNGTSGAYYEYHQGLKIKTKSIENTLLPLVNQISTLVNFKDNFSKPQLSSFNSEKTMNALLRVGETVNFAIERFVKVGETIAYENATIKIDMLEACREAKNAGFIIKAHTQLNTTGGNTSLMIHTANVAEKVNMIQAANTLLNSVTKVLLLADVVIINQILNSKNKVLLTLNKLENIIDFWNFVSLFTQYGTDLIELAHLTGERQIDLKDDKRKSQLSSSRWILEKSTAMILSSSKAYLKHLECECAKENVNLVYTFLQEALDSLHYVIVDSGTMFDFSSSAAISVAYKKSTSPAIVQVSFVNAYRQFEDALDLSRNNMLNMENGNMLILNALSCLIDSTQDFTDSLYINNDQRERIIRLQNEIREQTLLYLKEEHRLKQQQQQQIQEQQTSNSTNGTRFTRLFKTSPILNDCEVLKKLLQSQTMQLANCLFRENQDATLLNCIRNYSATNHYDLLIETLDKFRDYSEQVLELCKLLRHISTLDLFEVTCEHHYNVFENLAKMVQSAAGTAALYPECKSSTENLNLFCESWENQVNDLSVLVKEMQELMNGVKSNKSVYFSLPRPGKHGTNARLSSSASAIKPSKLDSNEKAKIAKLGLEMKLITSEIEAEADKWNEPQNEIVKLAKAMSDMAYEIHLFTRGEGSLKTTQDLFVRSDSFLQHGVLLYAIIKEFLGQVPSGYLKDELLQLIEKLPLNFKQLKNRLKQVTVGKTATFNKVDFVIQETRDFMNLVAKLVTSCFLCCTKYNINNSEPNENNFSEPFNYNRSTSHINKKHVNNQVNALLADENSISNKNLLNTGAVNHNNNNNVYSYTSSSSSNNNNNNRSDSCGPSFRSQLIERL